MATHRALVVMQSPDFAFWQKGQHVDYAGPPDWKLEPLDLKEREAWEAEVAQPDRVEGENRRGNIAGYFDEGESPAPPGVVLEQVSRYPASGWQG